MVDLILILTIALKLTGKSAARSSLCFSQQLMHTFGNNMNILKKIFGSKVSPNKPHIYTHNDKMEQLKDFIRSVDALCVYLPSCGEFSSKTENFQVYQRIAKELIDRDLNQNNFNELSLSVKPIIHLHKEWMPPLEETNSGWSVPDYFPKLEELHEKVMKSAFKLRTVGKY